MVSGTIRHACLILNEPLRPAAARGSAQQHIYFCYKLPWALCPTACTMVACLSKCLESVFNLNGCWHVHPVRAHNSNNSPKILREGGLQVQRLQECEHDRDKPLARDNGRLHAMHSDARRASTTIESASMREVELQGEQTQNTAPGQTRHQGSVKDGCQWTRS